MFNWTFMSIVSHTILYRIHIGIDVHRHTLNSPNAFEFHGLNCVQIMSIFIYRLWISLWLRRYFFLLLVGSLNTNQFTFRVDNFQLWHAHNSMWHSNQIEWKWWKENGKVPVPFDRLLCAEVFVMNRNVQKWIRLLCTAVVFNWPNVSIRWFGFIFAILRAILSSNCASYRIASCREFHINSKMVIWTRFYLKHASHILSSFPSISTRNIYKLGRNWKCWRRCRSILCVCVWSWEENIFFSFFIGNL